MTDSARTEEIRARVEKATPGPWVPRNVCGDPADIAIHAAHPDEQFDVCNVGSAIIPVHSVVLDADRDNADFIAHAREDVPYLLTELTALREEVERVRNEALELAAQEAERAPVVEYFRYYGREGTMVDDTRGTLASLAAKIRSLKSPAQQEPESA